MARIIIDYDESTHDPDVALRLVMAVVNVGRISNARGIDKYCHLTAFTTTDVICRDRRSESAADSFEVRSR